jgi:hypothetical protein
MQLELHPESQIPVVPFHNMSMYKCVRCPVGGGGGQILSTADASELNYILASANCARLLEVASTETIEMLTSADGRLPDLDTYARCALRPRVFWVFLSKP